MKKQDKEIYTFYHDGQPIKWSDFLAEYHAGNINNECYLVRLTYRQSWLNGHEVNEKAWSRSELALTDFMELPTATYKGEPLQGSSKLDEILIYRNNLRRYDHREEERPVRPKWFVDDSF